MENIDIFNKLGLTKEQGLIYENLINKGFSSAGLLLNLTGIKRGMVYKALDQLTEMG